MGIVYQIQELIEEMRADGWIYAGPFDPDGFGFSIHLVNHLLETAIHAKTNGTRLAATRNRANVTITEYTVAFTRAAI
jgi:hypothetical protein